MRTLATCDPRNGAYGASAHHVARPRRRGGPLLEPDDRSSDDRCRYLARYLQ